MSRMSERQRVPVEVWRAEGERLFGPRARDWAFRCPSCGSIQTPAEFVELGCTPEEAVSRATFSCIGRWHPTRGCDWTLGGLLQIHKLEVEAEGQTLRVFEFATLDNAPAPGFRPLGKVRS
ncbi:hypothetical protein MF271_19115 (plasmid) [Deinococcus sp. KNUC1210]|uniref:VVA0879 family protein n=1 Tax=Deinococcus sp. KNUC1210 TaxID=2917691 RepID=UPI001EF066D1|nr:VVA0879 family protein [Deinococcus sp. KNUC1210]ULH17432.1 hypothetical protein MF271_19115 [Deinococcus sp. KNUC1210]